MEEGAEEKQRKPGPDQLVDLVFGRLTAREAVQILDDLEGDEDESDMLDFVIRLKNFMESEELFRSVSIRRRWYGFLQSHRRLRTVNTGVAGYNAHPQRAA